MTHEYDTPARSLEDIATRVSSLEATNRRYRYAILAMLCIVVALSASAFDDNVPDVIRARKFEMIDTSGATLFEAGSDADGGRVIVRRRDGGGGMLFTNSEGGALGLLSPDGHVPFRAGVSPKGGLLVLTNNEDQFVLVAAADDSASGALVIYDKTGSEIWHAP
jgi:hypothetical protein